MLIKYESLKLQNYKSHQDLAINFGEITKITGDNTKGKSSILESISWLLYGTDALGGKTDPTPITYAAEETLVQLLLSVDEKQLLLGRGLKKGKVQYYINEVPSKAGEFNEVIEKMFEKELFLSLFNPSYFFTLHWEKQRAMLLQYVSAPARKDVLKSLPEAVGTTLEKYLKKHSLDDLEKIHKENKVKKDKSYIAAQSRTKTLKEQLQSLSEQQIDIDSIKAELAKIEKDFRELDDKMDSAIEKNREYNSLQTKIRSIQDQIEVSKERWPILKNEIIEDACRTCQRPLDEEAVAAVQADKDARIEEYKANHNALLKQRDKLKAELAEKEYIEINDIRDQVRELDLKGHPLRQTVNTYSQYQALETQVKNAEADENGTLQDLNASIFMLDSIKAYRAKEAELQGEKVQALFTTLSIKLFDELKNGEVKPSFEIEMDSKGYRRLSLSEGIRAGLELRDVLSQQSELITPCFVDNAESITSFKQPNGQLIISRVVAGQELKVEVETDE